MAKENVKKFFCGVVLIVLLLSIGAGISSSTTIEQKTNAPGNGSSQPLPTYTHTVLAEEATATWCQWCPYVIRVLHNEYDSGLYDFKYVALVTDMNTYANTRCNELSVTGYPTVVYDGGYTRIIGWTGSDTEYNNALNTCGARAVWNLDEGLTVTWLGNAQINISLDITNHQTSAYAGHVHAYVTEINSRWHNTVGGDQYHFAMIGNYAMNQNINVPASGNLHLSTNWNGNSYGMGDILPNNIMIVVGIFRSGTNYIDDTIGAQVRDTYPPLWQNQRENVTGILRGGSVLLSAQGQDSFGLNRAILQTNESGSWQNITGKYGSPMNLGGVGGQWVWTNFTWQNQAIPQGRRIGWRVFYNDTSGNWNRTNIMSFDILNNPILTDYTPKAGTTGDAFTFNASMVDDQGIAAAYVEYWYGSGSHTNLTMTHTNGNFYARTITVEANSLDSLHYVISAKDPLNYWSNTGEKIVLISDNDNPVWRNQGESRTSVEQGGSVSLYAQGKDNVALQWAWLATNESGQWLTYGGKPWWNLGWGYCKTIVINHSRVDADLTNFPVLISLISSDFVAHAQPNGNDFVFSDSTNTTKLNHEIEYYNSATGELVAWVNVPLISSTHDTVLNLYYGNATCGNQQNVIGTWNTGYLMVHHMTGATITNLKDSTGNHWDMTSQGGDPTYNQPGQIAKSVDFDPAGQGWDYFKAAGFRLPNNSTYTGSAWVYVDGSSGTRRYIFDGDSAEGISLLVWTDGRFKAVATTDTGGAYCYSTTQVTGQPQWQYVCTRADTTAERLDLFVNGVSENHSAIAGAILPETEGLNIATNMNNNQYYMNGRMDEIRISNVARSDSWIHTEYNMMSSPSTFTRVGSETIRDGGAKYGSPMNLNGLTDQWIWSNFTWQNPLIPEGRTVGWRIYYIDSSKNQVGTDIMSFVTGQGLPTVQINGDCYYQGMVPANTVSVEVVNTFTGQHWQASTNNNHYSLALRIGTEINAGDTLRFIARDNNESVNVTDHLVTTAEITAQAIHLDMILNIHYRDLKSFPYYPPQVDTGAAVMKMMLDYLMWNSTTYPNGPPSVYSEQTLYNTYAGGNYMSGDEISSGLNTEIDDYGHGWIYGYFFAPYASPNANDALKQICVWLDYPVNYYNNIRDVDVPKQGHPNHVPIAIPLYGNYNNWAVIRGIHTDRNAWLPPGQLTVYGFWVNGYLPGGIGENTYVTTSRFLSSYYVPLNVGGDAYNGKFLAITDPSRDYDATQLTKTKLSMGSIPTPLNGRELTLIKSLQDGKTTGVITEKANNALVKAAFVQTMNVLKYDHTDLAGKFANAHVVGKPIRNGNNWKVTFSSTEITIATLVDYTGKLLEFSIQ